MKPYLLWDLDGTICDSKAGIIRCFQYALDKFGLPVLREEDLGWVLGPPLKISFAKLKPGASIEEIDQLIAFYREEYNVRGMYENDIYADVETALLKLKNKKHFIATSKLNVIAKQILKHFAMDHHFEAIHGSEANGVRGNKGELIKYVLEAENIPPGQALMIGDREHDIHGAKAAGILAVGITWGYGSHEELKAAGADYIYDTPAALADALCNTN
jgi:phosphoglycolate phosphatase